MAARVLRQHGPLLAVLLLAVLLRLVNLNSRPVWYDEAFSILFAQNSPATMLAGTVGSGGAAAEEHPLLYYTGLHGWMAVWGSSPAGARTFSVLFSSLTVAMIYLLARRLYDRRTGWAAAFIAAIAPFAVYYGQEARMYALLGFTTVTMVYCFVRGWQTGERRAWAGFALFGALSLYAHNLAVVFIAGLDLWLVWHWWRGRRGAARWQNARPVILAHLLMLLLFAPWLLVLPRQLGKIGGGAYWITRPGLTELIQTLLIFHFAYDNQALPGWLLPPALLLAVLLPVLLWMGWRASRRAPAGGESPFPGAEGLLLSLTLAPVLLTFLISQARPVYVVRALLPSALMYYLLLARVLVLGRLPRPVKGAALLPALAVVLAALLNHYQYQLFPRPPFAAAVAYLAAEVDEGVVVHSSKLTYLPTYYYDPALPQAFLADPPGGPTDTLSEATQAVLGIRETAGLAAATAGQDRVWLVLFAAEVAEMDDPGREHPHLAWLNEHYHPAGVQAFNDLLVYAYRRDS